MELVKNSVKGSLFKNILTKIKSLLETRNEDIIKRTIDFKNPIKTSNLYESNFDRIISGKIEILSRNIISNNLEGSNRSSLKDVRLLNVDEEIAPIFVSASKIHISKEMHQKNIFENSSNVLKNTREVFKNVETNKVETLLELGISKYDLQKLDYIKDEIQYIIDEKGLLSYEKQVILNSLIEKYNSLYNNMFLKKNNVHNTKLSDYINEVTRFNSLICNEKEFISLENILSHDDHKTELIKIESIHKNLIDIIHRKKISRNRKQNEINNIIITLNNIELFDENENFIDVVEIVKLSIIKTIEINGYHTIDNTSQMYNVIR